MFSLGSSLGEDFSAEWIRAHTRDAHEILGKPFVLEEFGATGAGSRTVFDQRVSGGAGDEGNLLSPYISARAERARRADIVAQYYRGVSVFSSSFFPSFRGFFLPSGEDKEIGGGCWNGHAGAPQYIGNVIPYFLLDELQKSFVLGDP